MKLLPVLLTAFLSLTLPAEAQELWGDTEAGMTVGEVKEIHPNAAPPAKPYSLPKGQGDLLLEIPNIEILNDQYIVYFYFKGEKLSIVNVVLKESYYLGFNQFTKTYDEVLAAFRDKYGKETDHQSKRGEKDELEQHIWLSSDRKIQLKLSSGGGLTSLSFAYAARKETDSGKF